MSTRHHSPPAVRYPVMRRDAPWIVGAVLWLSAAALLVAWWRQTAAQPLWLLAVAVVLWLATGGALVQTWLKAPRGALHWDGGCWWWQASESAEAQMLQCLELRLDFQWGMLVAWRPDDVCAHGPWQHAWLTQSSAPSEWDDWRRAVYSASAASRTKERRA